MSLLSYCPIAESNNNAFKFQGALPKQGVQYVVCKNTFYRTPTNIYTRLSQARPEGAKAYSPGQRPGFLRGV